MSQTVNVTNEVFSLFNLHYIGIYSNENTKDESENSIPYFSQNEVIRMAADFNSFFKSDSSNKMFIDTFLNIFTISTNYIVLCVSGEKQTFNNVTDIYYKFDLKWTTL